MVKEKLPLMKEGSGHRIRNTIVGIGYVFLFLMVISAVFAPADTGENTQSEASTDASAEEQEQAAAPQESSSDSQESSEESVNDSTTQESSSESQESTSSESSGYEVRIAYDGEWSGSINGDGNGRSVDGEGEETFTVDGDPDIVSVSAQKSDDSDGEMTVQILEDGEVVEEQSTTAEYGVVSVSASSF